jgi:hypothetical protein
VKNDSLLREAYLCTTYWVQARPAPIALRVGAHSRALNRLLARHRAKCWAFVTAWNPRSQAVAPWCNARRQAQLFRLLANDRYRCVPALGEGDDMAWPAEPSVLVIGISHRDAMRLGRHFEQNAVLFGRLGGPATLGWC